MKTIETYTPGDIIEFQGKAKNGTEKNFYGLVLETGLTSKAGNAVLRVSEGRFLCLPNKERTVFKPYADSSFGLAPDRILRKIRKMYSSEGWNPTA